MATRTWARPYYHYKLPSRDITIDVTASIPSFPDEVDCLSDAMARFRDRNVKTILDFGAGKLRNTLYLLKQGYKVWAVEFKEAYDTPVARRDSTRLGGTPASSSSSTHKTS